MCTFKNFLIWCAFLVIHFGYVNAGILAKLREKRSNERVEFNFLQFLFGEHGLITGFLSSVHANKQNAPIDPPLRSLSDVVPLDQSLVQTRPPNLMDSLDVFFRKLTRAIDSHQRGPNAPSDPFDDFDLTKIGLCSRQTCGDLYKIVDNLKSSPIFKNLKLLSILLKDKEGLNILGQVLSDPELLKSVFTGNTAAVGPALLGLSGNDASGSSSTGDDLVKRNYTSGANSTGTFPGRLGKPETSASVDGKIDYYYYDGEHATENATLASNSSQIASTGSSRVPIDYAALYYDHDPRG